MRFLLCLLAIVALAAAYGSSWNHLRRAREQSDLLARRLSLANDENQRLRTLVTAGEKSRRLEKTKATRAEIEKEVAQLRGLPFKEPVVYASVSRKEIRDVFSSAMDKDASPAEYAAFSKAWHRLGLLPEPIDLRETLLGLLSEQVAAFYDQYEHKLYMFDEAPLESAQDKLILAHELTHALQDQHYGLQKLPLTVKQNDDRALAALALIEGDATQVMTLYMARHINMQVFLESATQVFSAQMEQLQKSPRALRERLLFPYLQGRAFVSAMELKGISIEDVYKAIPSSTALILHPDRYRPGLQPESTPIQWTSVDFAGHEPIVDNVVGEAGLRSLLGEWLGEKRVSVAEGWRADRYLYFAESDALVWKTIWRDEAAAQAFAEAENAIIKKRGRSSHLRVRAQTVELFDAPDAAVLEALEKQFGASPL